MRKDLRLAGALALALLMLGSLAGSAMAQTFRNPKAPCTPQDPPTSTCGDNYLESSPLNAPGSRLERRDTLVDYVNTAFATTQPLLLPGGPPEPTTCGPAPYGKTVWYDFYPDVHGFMQIRAETVPPGFNPVIGATRFDRATGRPLGNFLCANDSNLSSETFLVEVNRRRAYTTQIGGVNNTGGNLTMRFDFVPDIDADGIFDENDSCPRIPGSRRGRGCPPRLRADVKLRARPTATGVQIVGLSVAASRRSRVEVACSRRRCRRTVIRRIRRRTGIRRLTNVNLPAGTDVVIRVTRRGAIGAWIRYRISRGDFRKTQRCLNPGSRKPRRSCR
jgi:hypothetical protein